MTARRRTPFAKRASEIAIRGCATVGWLGYFPLLPGTVGTGVALWVLTWLPLFDTWLGCVWIAGMAALAVWTSGRAFGGKDKPAIIIDEVVGFMIAMWAIPKSPMVWALGFIAFRLFDMVKPFPIRSLEKLPKGWGIVLDDCLAGLYAHGVMRWVIATELGR